MNKLDAELIRDMIPDSIKLFAQPFVGKILPYKLVSADKVEINEFNLKIKHRDIRRFNLILSDINPIAFIDLHDIKNTLLYVEPPCANQLLPTGDYEAIVDRLLSFKGKVIFVSNDKGIYKRINNYLLSENGWHSILAKITNRDVKAIYCNFPAKEQLNLL
ncbi:MAG: hypothetical protein J6573_04685 [Lactobacillus sp.]|nr:hypothetical protein [Lactobacillus sp.]